MAHIELDRVGLTFRVRQQGRTTFKEYIIRNLFRRLRTPLMEVHALQDINLHIRAGERVGILGHNGAGKSTLLKVLAGIYPPSRGRRVVAGQISSLFDISLGFELEATGWENIAYRSYLQGETPRSVNAKLQSIADFSELGDFLNMPVRYYSAGMLVRLAFSIATAIEPEILLIDEVLSVGDMAFQEKARQRMREMMDRAELIVMVSHDLKSLAKLCDHGIWMDHGRVRQAGPMDDLVAAYIESVHGVAPAKEVRTADNKPKIANGATPTNGTSQNGTVQNGISGTGRSQHGHSNGHSGNGHDPASSDKGPNMLRLDGPSKSIHNGHFRPWLGPTDLRAYERSVYSQNGEDGILQEILRRIGTENKYFVEFGKSLTNESNCLRLALEEDWRGLLVEVNPDLSAPPPAQRFDNLKHARFLCAPVLPSNVEEWLTSQQAPLALDVLSIDVDGNDYWLWSAIQRWRPRVVIIEYNASYPPPQRWVMKEDPHYCWNGTNYFGASLASLTALGQQKGYTLVGTNSTGVNAFFVLQELATPDKFLDPMIHYHYSPPAYGPSGSGHPPGKGPAVEI